MPTTAPTRMSRRPLVLVESTFIPKPIWLRTTSKPACVFRRTHIWAVLAPTRHAFCEISAAGVSGRRPLGKTTKSASSGPSRWISDAMNHLEDNSLPSMPFFFRQKATRLSSLNAPRAARGSSAGRRTGSASSSMPKPDCSAWALVFGVCATSEH